MNLRATIHEILNRFDALIVGERQPLEINYNWFIDGITRPLQLRDRMAGETAGDMKDGS